MWRTSASDKLIETTNEVDGLVRLEDKNGFPALPSVDASNLFGIPGSAADQEGLVSFGSLLAYTASGGPDASEIQYVSVKLVAGKVYDRILVFIDSGGSTNRHLRVGVYDQTDPDDFLGAPNNRLTQSLEVGSVPPDPSRPYLAIPLTASWTVPTTGRYHIALVADSQSVKFNVTPSVARAGLLPVHRQATTGTDLPATTSGLTNPASALIYCALVEPYVTF